MRRLFLWLQWIVILVLAAGLAVLAIVMFWMPPNDVDSFNLVRERTARLSDYRLGKPLPGALQSQVPLDQRLSTAGFRLGAPIFIRIYKLSFELEVWIKRDSKYALFATYPICYFSGQLGPKIRYGDWQSPEGFYRVESQQLNAFSTHHRAFNLGFPNAYDRGLGRTGTLLEVHGGCSSVGCYAITNPAIDDVYKLASAAFAGGQTSFQVQALPFRLTADAMAAHAKHQQATFWSDLKAVADVFDDTHIPPEVMLCDGRYRAVSNQGSAANAAACRKL